MTDQKLKVDKYEWDELNAATPAEVQDAFAVLIKYLGLRTENPTTAWTAVDGLLTVGVHIAALQLAPKLEGSWSTQLDTAETILVRDEIADRRGYTSNVVRRNLARWQKNIRNPKVKE
jgi:hypothetical protein